MRITNSFAGRSSKWGWMLIATLMGTMASATVTVGAEQTLESISTEHGDVVCVVYAPYRGQTSRAGLVVHLYGSGGSHRPDEFNIGRAPYDDFRKRLSDGGYWLIVPDLGPMHWMNERATRQLDRVIAAMIERNRIDPRRVHLFGTSMGAGCSLMYVMQRPKKIRSLIALFPMTDFARWLDERPGYRGAVEGAHGVAADARDRWLARISPLRHPEAFRDIPLLLVHGDRDTVVAPQHSRDFVSAVRKIGGSVTFREISEETHRDEIAGPLQTELANFVMSKQD